jgi:hypothetical protein
VSGTRDARTRYDNPLARIADAVPSRVAEATSIAARAIGAAAAAYIAFDQSYDPTQAFAAGVIAVALASLIPVPAPWRMALAAFGAGVLFFGGALLLHEAAGVVMLVAGTVAAAATFVVGHRREDAVGLPVAAFFVAAGATIGWVAVILFMVEG